MANTVQQIYDPAAGYALYNDEWPNGTVSFRSAHAKGTPPPLLIPDCPNWACAGLTEQAKMMLRSARSRIHTYRGPCPYTLCICSCCCCVVGLAHVELHMQER